MSNFRYDIENKIFSEKLKNEVSKLNSDFKIGKIKTKDEYMYLVKESILNFYKNLYSPNFKIEEFANIPYKDLLIDLVKTFKEDLGVILTSTIYLSDIIYNSQKELSENIKFLSNKTQSVQNKVNTLETKIENLKKDSSIIFGDDFKTKTNTYVKHSLNKIEDALCDLGAQALTLPVKKNSSIMSKLDFEILNSSNGFPGNTHEVHSNNSSYIRFKGEDNPHISLNNIRYTSDANDSQIDTDYFEFELYNISDEEKNRTGNIGFKYKEDISWISDEESLKLNLKITLSDKIKLNHIVLTSIEEVKVSEKPIIKNIIISDDFSKMQKLNINKRLLEKTIINFETQDVKYIILEIEQSESYKTYACRQYALNIDPLQIPKYLDDEIENYTKYDKATQSIELLNLKYNKEDKSIIYPSTENEENFSVEYSKSKLFLLNQEDLEYNIKRDTVDSYRYSISLAEIDVRYREYKEEGIYISETFNSEEEIKKIIFEADDYIPKAFNDDKYINYYISFDGGSDWIKINPRHRTHLGPSCIYINSNNSIASRSENAIYYDTLYRVDNFKVKIELSRPIDNSYSSETPRVEKYNVIVSSEEDM